MTPSTPASLMLIVALAFAPALPAQTTESVQPIAPAATAPAVAEAPAAPAGPLASLSTTLTVGYDSRYVLYGYSLSRHLYRADVGFYLPINDIFSAWAGSWAGYLPDGTYQEVDAYAGIDAQIGKHLSTGVGYSIFNYIEAPFTTADASHEFAGHVSATGGPFSLAIRNQYDTEADGSLLRAIAKYRQPVCDKLALTAEAEYGYSLKYYTTENGANHAQFKLAAPISTCSAVVVTPFIAHSRPLDVIKDYAVNRTYGGISMAVTF